MPTEKTYSILRRWFGKSENLVNLDLMTLEERILYSATPAPDPSLAADGSGPGFDLQSQILDSLQEAVQTALFDSAITPDSQTGMSEVAVSEADANIDSSHELLLVDQSIANVEQLVSELLANAGTDREIDVVYLNSHEDGFAQVDQALAGSVQYDALHFLTHGDDGMIRLGGSWLDLRTVESQLVQIEHWSDSLTADGDIFIYGCDLAAVDDGQLLIERLHELTGADIAASDDDTGNTSRGGDWELETHVGVIESTALGLSAADSWDGLLATYTVTNTNDSGAGSLRQAMLDANGNAGADTIAFNIAGGGPHIITLSTALPTISEAVTIDGWTEPSFATNGNRPIVVVDGNDLTTPGFVLNFNADGTTIRGLVIRNFDGNGITINGASDSNTISGNYIGQLDTNGNDAGASLANTGHGIYVGGGSNTIGGSTAQTRNIISGNWMGIQVNGASADNNWIYGNYIGTDAAGSTSIGNVDSGILIDDGVNNTIGTDLNGSNDANEGNVVASSGDTGIQLWNAAAANNLIRGNKIGVNAAGTAVLGNAAQGIQLGGGTTGNTIGGTSANAANIVGGSTFAGIELTDAGTNNNLIQGNYVGTNASGTNLANGSVGIYIQNGASSNTIGGTTAGAGNTVRFNVQDGIAMFGGSTLNNPILRNTIFDNGEQGIDLNIDGLSNNDTNDADAGANSTRNFPVITNVVQNGADLDLTFGLELPAGWYRIEFYENPSGVDPTGAGEGQIYLGAVTVQATGAAGYESFARTLTSVTATAINGISATATSDTSGGAGATFGATSEFGPSFAGSGVVVVNTTSDVADGDTTSITTLLGDRGADGFISLREAITAANNTANGASPDEIHFNISGTGTHTINVTSALPTITAAVIIDATTDDSFAVNSNRPAIILDGNNSFVGDGLVLTGTADGTTIRGFVIRDFSGDGIEIQAGSDSNTIAGNYIGRLTTAGIDAGATEGNTASGIHILSSGNTIGGTTAADRNVISGNGTVGINLAGAGAGNNVILGNYIGTTANGLVDLGNVEDGIQIDTGAFNNTIGGLTASSRNVVSGNDNAGIAIDDAASTGNTVLGNYIGLGSDGSTTIANTHNGININAAVNTTIGSTDSAGRNVIGGNTIHGIGVTNAGSTLIYGNYIGLDATGSLARGNLGDGIRTTGTSSGIEIGGILAGTANVIANNAGDGVFVSGGTGVTMLGNSIYSNTGLGIDLGTNGVTANDADDVDSGANNLQNFPVLATAVSGGGNTTITGTFNSTATTTFRIEFFSSPTADGTGYGEGQTYLGFAIVTTDVNGDATINSTLTGVIVAAGNAVSATATVDLGGGNYGSTSEFAQIVAATGGAGILMVDTTSDVADGDTSSIAALMGNKGADGVISLREAITATNNTANGATPDEIQFEILAALVGGAHTINVAAGGLPQITDSVIIDGTTDSDFGSTPIIVLNGSGAGGSAIGLEIQAASTIRGLVIHSFGSDGIWLTGGATGSTIVGNYIGTDVTGSNDLGNNGDGIESSSSGHTIGGSSAADRNVISGNGAHGINFNLGGNSNTVQGNYIGLNAAGSAALGNGGYGIYVNAADNVISGNSISGNLLDGILLDTNATNAKVHSNFLGTNAGGTTDVGNSGDGVEVRAASVTIGGNVAGYGNVIGGNSGSGILITGASATGTIVLGNAVGTDASTTLAIANDLDGIRIASNASGAVIGELFGNPVGGGNVVSGNLGYGLAILSSANSVSVIGNSFGVDANGTTALANGSGGIYINSAANNTIGGSAAGSTNVISGNSGNGVSITGVSATGNVIQANMIGMDANGANAIANTGMGIYIDAPSNTVGGTTSTTRNIISGNVQEGIVLTANADSSVIRGNYIGTDATGLLDRGNGGSGIWIQVGSDNNTIGGNIAGAGNVISGNNGEGIALFGGNSNTISGNLIGLGADGSTALGNSFDGIHVAAAATNNTIGGTTALERNIISANGARGVQIEGSGSTNNFVYGNYIGTDSTGTLDRGNTLNGVLVGNGAGANVIGQAIAGGGNVVSGNNGNAGIEINGSTTGLNVVIGNIVGLNAAGLAAIANSGAGILINGGQLTTIGGTTAAERNVISGNTLQGIRITANTATANMVQGNYIGTNVAGTAAIGNTKAGIQIDNGADSSHIGGTAAGAGNVIAGSGEYGIYLTDSGTIANRILGNFIGTNSLLATGLGNAWQGIAIDASAANNMIGGDAAGAGNTIAYSGFDGIALTSSAGSGNAILQNEIFLNGGLGIDLHDNGVTANDANDVDSGANGLQNFPVLTGVVSNGGNTTISGTFNSTAGVNTFRIEYFSSPTGDASGNGEGQTYLGFDSVTTDGSGNATINTTLLGVSVTAGHAVSATATVDLGSGNYGSTSEFSVNTAAVGSLLVVDTASNVVDGNTSSIAALLGSKGADGFISLREAITAANNTANGGAPDEIHFNIAGAGPHTINLNANIPTITDAVVIDGTTQPGYGSAPLIELNGQNARTRGFALAAGASGTIIRGLAIGRFTQDSIQINSASDVVIEFNYLGLDPTGLLNHGNASDGIEIVSGTDTIVRYNTITNQTQSGVFQDAFTTGTLIQENLIFGNGLADIDLEGGVEDPFWITANDAGDGDSGANQLQNFPVLSLATTDGTDITIGGNINSVASRTFRVEFFAGSSLDASGHGQAERFLGWANVTTDGSGNGAFVTTFAGANVTAGEYITATATDLTLNNTSEFAAQLVASSVGMLVVDTTSDVADGNTASIATLLANKGADGYISLREAILATNNTANAGAPDEIHFNIAGAGPHTINVYAALPTITESVTIDGFTQTGATANTIANGSDAVLQIVLDGNDLASDGLTLGGTADGSTIRGLVIRDFGGNGIVIQIGSNNNTIAGNFIGRLDSSGGDAGGAEAISLSGIYVSGSNNTIGGTSPADRNVISGSTQTGIMLQNGVSANNNLIVGNFIGTNAAGTIGIGNSNGVAVAGGSGNIVGGTTAGTRNLIAGNSNIDLELSGTATGTLVQGNYVGVNATLTGTIAGNAGITLSGATGSTIGGSAAGAANIFGGHGNMAFWLLGNGSGTVIQGNFIGTDPTETLSFSNSVGVNVSATATGYLIGGTTAGTGNIFTNGNNNAIQVAAGANITILGNSIHTNTGLGIDLNNDGVTLNDLGDADNGGNNLQNFPVLASAVSASGNTTITGTFNSNASTTYRVEFFSSTTGDPTGHGEGQTYLGFTVVTTDASGNATINALLTGVSVTAGHLVTATATVDFGGGNYGETSEFALNVGASGVAPGITVSAISGNTTEAGGTATFTIILDSQPTNDVTINVSSNDLTEGTVSSSSLTFTATNWNIAQTVTVTGVDDLIDDGDIPYTIITAAATSSDGNYNNLNAADVAVTNTDDDTFNTLIVDTTSDVSDGDTSSIASLVANKGADGLISLREAITAANNSTNSVGGADRIYFNIAAPLIGGAHTINVGAGGLPAITDAVIIDGSTEPDSTASPVVVLNGAAAGASAIGLNLDAGSSGSTLRGLVIQEFDGRGILIVNGSGNNLIAGNYIGTDVTGMLDRGNGAWGVDLIVAGNGNVIGGSSALDRNIISGNNTFGGIAINGGFSNTAVRGNYIGVGADGSTALGNGGSYGGITLFNNPTGVIIGGVNPGEGNIIAYNGTIGVNLTGGTASILGNLIFGNTGLGIDLASDGVTANDTGDVDAGANGLQNFPVLGSVESFGATTRVMGALNSNPNTTYRVEFFSNPSGQGDPTGYGEGQNFLDFITLTTDASGDATFIANLAAIVPGGSLVTATATMDLGGGNYGETSEFALNAVSFSPGVIVTQTLPNATTSEEGLTDIFSVVLNTQPTNDVVINVATSDATEGTVGVTTLTFTSSNWNVAQNVTITGVGDTLNDGNTAYTIILSPAMSADVAFNGVDPTDVSVINLEQANDPPVNSVPGAQVATEDAVFAFSTANGNAISISDPDAGTNNIEVTLLASNGVVTLASVTGLTFIVGDGTADVTLTFRGTIVDVNSALDGLSFLPTLDYVGPANISLTTNDLGNTGIGGAQSDSDAISIDVVNSADAPQIVLPGAIPATNEDTPLSLTAASNFALQVQDADVGELLQLTISVVHGDLTLASTAGLTFQAGDGVSDRTLTFTGIQAALNAALDGAIYQPDANYHGSDTLNANVRDSTALTAANSHTISIAPVNDAPVATADSYTMQSGQTLTITSPAVLVNDNDIDGDPMSVTWQQLPTHGTFTGFADGSFVFTPTAGFFGTETFTYRLSDGNAQAADTTVTVTVIPVGGGGGDSSSGGGGGRGSSGGSGGGSSNGGDGSSGQNNNGGGGSSNNQNGGGGGLPDDNQQQKASRSFAPPPIAIEETRSTTARRGAVETTDGATTTSADLLAELNTAKRRHENQLRFDSSSNPSDNQLIDWANITENQVLDNLLSNLRQELRGESDVRDLVASTATAATAALSAGYAIWALKSGHLLASLLASMPAWRHIDPLPVVDDADRMREDNESLADIATRGEK